jgi:hypothetical protein
MNIAFVALGHKRPFFDLVSKSMMTKNKDLKVFWICVARREYDNLLASGWHRDDLLLLNWDIRNGSGKAIGEYKLHELAYADRRLKYHFDEAIVYLKKMQSLFCDFVNEKKLQYIFGEMTAAHEILMNRICLDKFSETCFYLHPQSIRIPNRRFTFMDTEFQNSIFSKAEYIYGSEETEKFELPIKPVVPERVADVAKDVKRSLTFKYKLNRLLGFFILNRFKKLPKDSLTALPSSLGTRITKFLETEHNKYYYTKRLPKSTLDDLQGKKFFLITLHMQPEASIDVVGRYYDDQFLVIRDVWRILPNDYYLVIKEHTNAIGNRGREFFEKCKKLKNLLIIHEETSSHKLIQLAETIFTNSGTVALEGALYQKDVFLFSSIFFDKLKYCHRISLEDLKYTSNFFQLLEKCRLRDSGKMTCEQYSEYIIRSSFPGVVDGHKGSHFYTDSANIETIARSFLTFLTHKDNPVVNEA